MCQDFFFGADDEARTRYLNLGKVALYQMSYIRIAHNNVIISHGILFVKTIFEIFLFLFFLAFMLLGKKHKRIKAG